MIDEPTALDRFMTGRAPAMMFVGLAGVALLLWIAVGAFSAPWHLDDQSPTVMSSTAECDARLGARYEIRVEAESYGSCGGATNKCAEVEAVEIAYDPDDPSQCRVASAVDGLGRYEATLMLLGLGLSFAGLAGLSFLRSQRVRRGIAAADPDDAAARSRFVLLQRITWAALAAAVMTANGTAIFALM